MSEQTFTIPKISSGPASAATFNAPLEYIEDALNDLDTSIHGLNNKSAVLQWQAPVASDVSVGDLVYSDGGVFKKALAALSSQTGANGQAIEAASCHVQGLVLSINTTEGSATILKNGYCESSVIASTIGAGAQAGLYYLSASDSGKATRTPGWDVRLPVISYYGDGKFSVISNYFGHIGDGDAVIRHLQSQTLEIGSNSDGVVAVEIPVKTVSAPEPSAYAVSGIVGNTISTSPHVSMLIGGAGIKAAYKGSGIWSVSLDSLINKPLAATDFTLNGAQRVADTLLTYTVFPSGVSSSMVMTMPVDFVSSTAFNGKIKVWATAAKGAGTLDFQLYWIPYTGTNINIALCKLNDIENSPLKINNNNTSGAQLKYNESQQGIQNVQINTSGILVARAVAKAPSNQLYIHQAGFKLELEEVSDSSSVASGITREDVLDLLQQILVFNPNYGG